MSESIPLSALLLFFMEIITLLVVETNSQDQGQLDSCGVEGQERHVPSDKHS
jgi:hypothetical protein